MKDETARKAFHNSLRSNILEPEGYHHVLAGGRHGRKLEFERIDSNSVLFDQWIEATVTEIEDLYFIQSLGKMALLSVANGTNRLVEPVAERVGINVTPLFSRKLEDGQLDLPDETTGFIKSNDPELILILEDVGTEGTNSSQVARAAMNVGARQVEVLNTWQRSPNLPKLDALNIVYHAVIYDQIETFTPEACQASGPCSEGWRLI